MIRLIVVPKDLSLTRIFHNGTNKGPVSALPEKFADRLIGVIGELRLREPWAYAIQYSENAHTCLYGNGKCLVPNDHSIALTETIKLLHWRYMPHTTRVDSSTIKSKIVCHDCNGEELIDLGGRCSNLGCISHSKWAEMDSAYVRPDPFMRAFAGMNIGAEAAQRF